MTAVWMDTHFPMHLWNMSYHIKKYGCYWGDVESPKAARGKLNKKDFRRNYNGVVEKIL